MKIFSLLPQDIEAEGCLFAEPSCLDIVCLINFNESSPPNVRGIKRVLAKLRKKGRLKLKTPQQLANIQKALLDTAAATVLTSGKENKADALELGEVGLSVLLLREADIICARYGLDPLELYQKYTIRQLHLLFERSASALYSERQFMAAIAGAKLKEDNPVKLATSWATKSPLEKAETYSSMAREEMKSWPKT